ncbi:MAG: 3,4-dihydroxy-2-butanone-4-phosphate synthase [Phycisphaerae bacterium]|nr:3,4-dihydroxy-2-butanone-4-phosphate synthase [Phycisphaerae bacterium]
MLDAIPDILEDLRNGKIIILVDDEDRENEGDFVCAAEKMTPEIVNFLMRIGAGYLCVAMRPEDCDRLDLTDQAKRNTSVWGTPFTVSVDGHPRHGVGTGVSSTDRSQTIKLLADPSASAEDFVRPGHINPLRAREGGVLVRTGQTEGSVDLCRLAGLRPAAAIIEIVNEDGSMARMPDLRKLADAHGIRMCSVEQIIEYRLGRETLVSTIPELTGTVVDTPEGPFDLVAFRSAIDPLPHLALTLGGVGLPDANGIIPQIDEPILVRMHRRDVLGDVFGATGRPGQDAVRSALRAIREEGRGALVYLRPESMGGGIGDLLHGIQREVDDDPNAPDLTRTDGVGARAQPPAQRDFGIGGQILRAMGLTQLRLLASSTPDLPGLQAFGLTITGTVPFADDESEA